MSDLVGNPEDWFSHNEAHIPFYLEIAEIMKCFIHKSCKAMNLRGNILDLLLKRLTKLLPAFTDTVK